MGTEQNRSLVWVMAVGISLGLHILVIAALLGVNGGEKSGDAEQLQPAQPVQQTPSAAPTQAPGSDEGLPSWSRNLPEPTVPGDAGRSSPADTSGTNPKIYVVKSGDRLTDIAKKDGSTMAELAKLNGKTVKELANLKIGQKIKVKNGVE